jgi:DNA-binding response OmpR family regulator
MTEILIVEDDDGLRELLADALDDLGYSVTVAARPRDAIGLAATKLFSLVITDVRMEGMDGVEMLIQLKDRQPQARSIVITGFADQQVPRRAIEAGVSDYLHKPFTAKDLLAAVRRVLARDSESAIPGGLVKGFPQWDSSEGQDQAWELLERSRTEAYRGFYIAVRAGLVDLESARALWQSLSETESLRRDKEPDLDLIRSRFEQCLQAAGTPASISGAGPGVERFPNLFARIREGEITLEQLKTADLLHSLNGSPEVEALREKIWGALSAG